MCTTRSTAPGPRSTKLDASELVQNIAAHKYGAIQLHAPVGSLKRPNELFPDAVLDALSHLLRSWI
jgi:hypothetical protein